MAFNLGDMLKNVPNLGTGAEAGREQIEYLPLSQIEADPNNFYELSGIEELAANIELLGLQQPLRVRPHPEKPESVILVSGHRRLAALALLAGEGKIQFDSVPCIREAGEGSAALQELRLIYANSDTRKLTSAEISKQAERVEALLYQLKEEGMEFPGRMRDHVAEACKVSKSKLSRLKVIREKLAPCFHNAYEKGALSESAAYALAQQPEEIQKKFKKYNGCKADNLKYVSEYRIRDFSSTYEHMAAQKCKAGKPECINLDAMLAKLAENSYAPCTYNYCCDCCHKLATCKNACPALAEKIQKLKADKKAEKQQEKLAQQQKDQQHIDFIRRVWERFGAARENAGLSIRQVQEKNRTRWYGELANEETVRAWEQGAGKIEVTTLLPFGGRIFSNDAERICMMADVLGCTTDFLLGRTTAEPAPCAPEKAAALKWKTGTPEEAGEYLCYIRSGYFYFVDSLKYKPEHGWQADPDWAAQEDIKGWLPMPEDPDE